MKKTLFFMLPFCVLLQKAGAQTTVTLQCSQDVAVGYDDGSGTNGNNFGGAVQNAAFCVPGLSPQGLNVNRALIDFNLSVLPATLTLVSAKLNLYALGPLGSLAGHTGSANASTLQRITQSWQEYSATWTNQPSGTTQNQVTLNQSTSPTQDYLNIDVTAMVQDMLNNPLTSFGFKLQLLNEAASNALVFASRDCSNANLHPTLAITYRQSNTGTATGLSSNLPNEPFSVYPNPNTGTFCIKGLIGGTSKVIIFNDLGQEMKNIEIQDTVSATVIDVNELPNGIYFCKLISSKQEAVVSRIIISKN
jgi:hypothetical protein